MFVLFNILSGFISVFISFAIAELIKGRNISDVGIRMYENSTEAILSSLTVCLFLQSISIILIYVYFKRKISVCIASTFLQMIFFIFFFFWILWKFG